MGSKFIAFIVLILSLLLVFSCGRSAFGPGDGDGGAEDAGQDGSDSDIACEVTGDCPEGYQCKNGRCLLGWTTTSVLETGNIAVGLNGEVYIAGTFQGDFDFDPGPNEDRHSSIGARDGYILTLSALGEYKRTVFFSGSIESDSLKELSSMDVDQVGDIYIGGVVDRGRIDVDPGPAVEQVVASEDVPGLWGKRPVFIVRLSPEMDMRWVDTCWGYVDIEVPVGLVDIDVTESGMVIATGYYYRLEWMDSQSSDFISILAYGVATFVRKLKTIGEHVWTVGQQARELDHNDIQPMQLAVARSGDVFVVGSGLQGYADVDLDPGPKEEWRSMTGPFVWHLDADGEYQGALDGFQYSSHIASHIFGGLLVGSSFKGEFDIDPGPGIDIRHSIDDSIDSYALLLDTEYNILWPWVSGIPGDDKITAMASDDQGRIYLAVSLEEGSLLVALGPEGNELWRRDFPGLVNDMVASNKNGLYLFGGFSKEGDFDPGPGEDIRSPTVPVDTFVTRLSLSGTY